MKLWDFIVSFWLLIDTPELCLSCAGIFDEHSVENTSASILLSESVKLFNFGKFVCIWWTYRNFVA